MKTARDRAAEFLINRYVRKWDQDDLDALEIVLKDQDKITRHACAEVVLNCNVDNESPTGGDLISPEDAHDACMNVKAV